MKKLAGVVDRFNKAKISVVGDLILDQFIWGETDRISPEAPVPVLKVQKETFIPGGSGNTANNIASLGGKVSVLGLVGKDKAGQELLSSLKRNGVETRGVIQDDRRPTTHKTRVIAQSQHVVRIDRENGDLVSNGVEEQIVKSVEKSIGTWNVLVFSDYAKGLLTPSLISKLLKLSKKHGKITIADIKPEHAGLFEGVDVLTPNLKEARAISGKKKLEKMGRAIQNSLRCKVVITQGAEGMTVFDKGGSIHLPAKAREVFDVSGAGDTVVAVLALSLATGLSLKEAAEIANHAAGIVVGKMGTAVVSPKELKDSLLQNE